MRSAHLAIDLGASSGRAVLGVLEVDRQVLEEVHRFEHLPIDTPSGPVWDFTGIVNNVLTGLRRGAKAAEDAGVELRSVGVDTWGVDWTVVAPGGDLVGLPRCYRDPSNAGARAAVLDEVEGGVEGVYRRSGIQPLPFNTLFQLHGRLRHAPELVPANGKLQLMPDVLHYLLSGKTSHERTNASTGSLLSAETAEWDHELLASLGLPKDLFGPLIDAGTCLGKLRPELAAELGVPESIEVVAPATHDTASAIAAVPAVKSEPGSWAYLSSGTWSLLGVELRDSITSKEALDSGFTNEIGAVVNGKPSVRFLRNIGGLWLIQELQRDLARTGTDLSFAELASLAEAEGPFRTLIDPNATDLAAPGDSIAKLKGHASRSDQPIPETAGQLARCCLDSLAMCYAETIDRLERLTGRKIEVLHIVGGGSQNELLNRLTASAVGRPVVVGPVEATAIGNLLLQAKGLGLVSDLHDVREIVARSFAVKQAEPLDLQDDWSEKRNLYATLTLSQV